MRFAFARNATGQNEVPRGLQCLTWVGLAATILSESAFERSVGLDESWAAGQSDLRKSFDTLAVVVRGRFEQVVLARATSPCPRSPP